MGRPQETSTDDVLDVFDDREDPCEPLTAPEIADALGCSADTARDRLDECVWMGELERKEAGAHAVVYWRPGG